MFSEDAVKVSRCFSFSDAIGFGDLKEKSI